MNISGPFIRRPIGTSLLAMGVFVIGMICYALLGVAALPDMQFPVIFVTGQPGRRQCQAPWRPRWPRRWSAIWARCPASTRCARPVRWAAPRFFMMFDAGRNIDAAARDVQAAINAAQPDLPTGLNSPPSYEKANPNDDPIIAFALTSDTQSARDLYDVADSLLAQRLRQLTGHLGGYRSARRRRPCASTSICAR
jgi:multidrug efflux pump